jgi:putative oxidoreductase
MTHWRQAATDLGHLAIRLPGLYMAIAHGWGKVAGMATGGAEGFVAGVAALGFPLPTLFAWAAALAEFAGGLMVAVGLLARVGAAFAAFTMFVAAFGAHKAHLHALVLVGFISPSAETVERWGSPEMALVYLCAFVGVLVLGPGRLSLDHLIRTRRGKK